MRLLALALLLVPALVAGQRAPDPLPYVPATDSVPVVTLIDMRVAQLLDVIQRKVLDAEHAVCLLGRVTPDSTVILDVRAARITYRGSQLNLEVDCNNDPSFIGFAHNHPPVENGVGCGISLDDLLTFVVSPRILVMVHTCTIAQGTGIVVRRRDRYEPATVTYAHTPPEGS